MAAATACVCSLCFVLRNMQPFSAKFSSKCWIRHVAHLHWTYYKFFLPWQQSPSVARSSDVRFLSVVWFAFVSPIPSIFILGRLHDVHCVASWSLSAQLQSNDAAGRVGIKGRNYPAGAQKRRQLKREV